MPASTARVLTDHGRKYMTQLAKHWSHRFPELTYDENRADVPLPGGPLTIAADETGLTLTLSATDIAGLERMQGVVVEHLNRFAFRETLVYAWIEG